MKYINKKLNKFHYSIKVAELCAKILSYVQVIYSMIHEYLCTYGLLYLQTFRPLQYGLANAFLHFT